MLVVSFIRHGESLDNLKLVWAGFKDGELSELGVRQAKALGEAYANVHLDAIITSDLKRAHATAVALLDGQPQSKPSFIVDRDLREQYLGDAEGSPWLMHRIPNKSLDDHYREGRYPALFDRTEKFPNGESLNDLAQRAERFVDELLLKPYLIRAISSNAEEIHVAVVSHGLCINELICTLLKRNDEDLPAKDYKGLLNTAWTRVTVQVKPGAQVPQMIDGLEALPPLIVTVTDVNRHDHIINLVSRQLHDAFSFLPIITSKKRDKGIVEDDPEQRSIREFFGAC